MTDNLLPFPLLTVPRAANPSVEAWRRAYAALAIEIEDTAKMLVSVHPEDDETIAWKVGHLRGLVDKLAKHVERGAE